MTMMTKVVVVVTIREIMKMTVVKPTTGTTMTSATMTSASPKKQVEEGKYAPKPLKQGLVKIEFVPQGGKVPDRKKANKTMVSQSNVKW